MKEKVTIICWDSIKLLTALFLLWGVCFGEQMRIQSEYQNNF